MSTRILTQKDVKAAITMPRAIAAVEEALGAYHLGEAQMPPKVYLSLEEFNGDFRAMPAYFGKAAGVKWVNSHPDNTQKHQLPTVMGVYILNDPETALPLAVLDGTYLTAMRTGAAAAVASRFLAPSESTSLGLLGCGVQAQFLLDAHQAVFQDLKVLVADRDITTAQHFAEKNNASVVNAEELARCDILCTSTPSRAPVMERGWLKDQSIHINAMGADAPGKQELHGDVLHHARVFVDDFGQATHSGEVNVPLQKGDYTREQIEGTLGGVITGALPRRSPGDKGITIFDSTGLAIQDAAVARAIYEEAEANDLGLQINFLD